MATVRHNEISLPIPSAWHDATQVMAVGPAEGDFRATLVVSQEPCREAVGAFAAQQLPSLQKAIPGLKVVQEGPATFGAHRGFLREHGFAVGGRPLAQLQFYVVAKGKAYTVTFTHRAEKLAANRKLAEKAFAGLKVDG